MTAAPTRQPPKVPGFSVSLLGDEPIAGSEPGKPLAFDVLADVRRVEVTQVNTGQSHYTITFNNWFLETPDDPRASKSVDNVQAAGPVKRTTLSKSPFWPRFKYNDFSLLKFGQRLRIDMRYWPGTKDAQPGGPSSQDWVAMVSGPITDMRFSFATGQGAELTVSGEDDLSVLKDKQDRRIPLKPKAEVGLVKEVLGLAKLALPLAEPPSGYKGSVFVKDDSHGINEAVQSGQSWLEFINKLAERLDFEVFAEFKQAPPTQGPAQPGSPPSFPPPLEVHFEPYRGRVQYDEDQRSIYRIDRERNLLDFNPTIKVGDQYSVTEVRGRHRDPQLAQEVKAEATHDVLKDELQRDPKLDGTLKTGPEVRATFFPSRPSRFVVQNEPNMDPTRADAKAQAVLRKKARELFTIDVTIVGDPRVRPGRHVEIRGMRPPFDGFYYATTVVHTYGGDGLRTKITASRPGMELPPNVATGRVLEPTQDKGAP